MSMPDAGAVHVDVLPDLKKFGPQLRRELKEYAAKERASVPVGLDTEQATADLKTFKAQVDNLGRRRPRVKVSADTQSALARLVGVEKAANRLDGRVVNLTVRTNQKGEVPTAPPAGGTRGGGGFAGGRQQPFTGASPAASAAAFTAGPALIPAVGALTGALGGLTSGFGAAGAASIGFATAVVPAVMDVAEVLDLQEQAAEGGKEATKQYQQALSDLTPAARGTVEAWGSLTDAYTEWQRGLQGDTLPVVTHGIEILEKELPSLTPIVRESAAGFDGLLSSAQAALDAPYWERFTDFAARQAEPSIGILGRSVGNLAMGFTGLLVSFEPLWNTMGPGIEDLTRKFAAWANTSSNFTGFIDWTIQNGPTFAEAFVSIADAALDVGVAIAPLGTVYAKSLGQLAEAVSWVADTAPWLIQAAVAFGTLRVAIGLFGRVNQGVIQPLREMPGRIRDAASSLPMFSAQADTAASSGGRFRGAVSGAVGVLGGPWGLAITAATTAVGIFAAAKMQAAQQVQVYTDAIRADSGALGENTRQTVAKTLEDEGLLEISDQLGISLTQVTNAAIGQGDALKQLNATIGEQINQNERAYAQGELAYEQYSVRRAQLEDLRDGINGQNQAVNESVGAYQREQEAIGASTEKQGSFNSSVATGAANTRDLKSALDALTNSNITAAEAEIRFEEAIDQATAGIAQNGATLNTNTAAGRANRRNLIELSNSTHDHLAAMKENGAGADQMKNAQERARKKFIEVARQMGATKKEANQLANEYLGMPDDVNTAIKVTAKGTWSLPKQQYGPGAAQLYADGGFVSGPGTATSDSIPARLSDGEFVQQASAVDYYGVGLMDALNQRRVPKGAVQGFASGGFVTRGTGPTEWDQVDDHRTDTTDAWQRSVNRLIAWIGTEAAEQWKNFASGPMGVVRLAQESLGRYPESPNNTNAITKWYGMNGAPWCAMFISWLFAQTGASRALGSAARTAWTGDYYTSGMRRAGYPQPGDVAVYGEDHVNLVVSPGGARRIGGNQSNNVTSAPYSGGAIFRPMWGRVGFAEGGLVDILSQDRREDGRHPLLDYPELVGLAGGGMAKGWTVVGEQGPELARFDSSAQVYSTQESARMLAEAARATTEGARGGDGADSPLIGSYHQHLHSAESSLREAMGELTHTLRVARKGGVFADG